MSDITNEIDEYFHPQAKILRKFYVPSTLFHYEINDLRSYLWHEDKDSKIIKIGPYINKDKTCLIGSFQRKKLDIKGNDYFCNSNLRVILVEDVFHGSGKSFILLDNNNKLIQINGKLIKANEDINDEI